MRETSCAQRVLALFTSPECAEAIAGDFAEARGDRSAAWFWWQVLTTATALGGRAIATAPLASVGVAVLGVLQFGSLAFAGFAPVAMFPALLSTPASWVWLSVTWWSGAFFTGFTLVSLSPARGALGSVLLALIGAALLLVSRLVGLDGRDLHIPNVVFWSITTFTAVPLLAGAMAARSRVASVATAAPAR